MHFYPLKDRPCTDKDFEEDFFPLHKRMEGLSILTKKMKCVEDPYEIWGDYNSDKTANV